MKDLRNYVARRVIVETDLASIEGTVERATADSVTLQHVSLLSDEGSKRPVDGLVVVPRERIAYVQVP